MAILAQLVGLACLVPFIIVLIKLFQQKGVLHGILGILCALYTFIWGWMNASTLNIKNVMILWTVLIVVGAVLNIMFASSALTTPQLAPP
ncbi:MAG TPA: hypothetical protein VFD27_19525 [Chthoniobacteraceae bacterium]|jgi:hypothetical protein|nr:hypothetical protein [Chthoniobacteraceae bacterium]